jgi:hypothetical protein
MAQIGTDTDRTVEEGCTWRMDDRPEEVIRRSDFSGPKGPARRLGHCQVTIDNQPPELKIIHPALGGTIHLPRSAAVFEAQAGDDLALEQVEFYIDGQWWRPEPVSISFLLEIIPGRHFTRQGNRSGRNGAKKALILK